MSGKIGAGCTRRRTDLLHVPKPLAQHLLFFLLSGILSFGGASPPALAANVAVDLPGSHDDPLLSRYAGSALQNVAIENYSALRVPSSAGTYGSGNKLSFERSTTVEGKIRSYFYIAPKERSALEVFRNYEAALKQSGFVPLYRCELHACDAALIREPFVGEVVRSRKWTGKGDPSGSVDRDVRFISAKLTQNGNDVYVMVFVAEPNSLWSAPATVVLIAEPAAVEIGKVVVTADMMRSALNDNGKISLYGIYFDTGRAELKAESAVQLEEMSRLMAADTSIKFYIVGHTDNQGQIEANTALSQRRAEAVVAALVGKYKVERSRLLPRGLASFAPVVSNRDEAGRAKNRRVELVEQ